jgi:hypothetical protein
MRQPMLTRRNFIKSGAMSGLALAALGSSAYATTRKSTPIYKVLVDQRYPGSADFGVEAMSLGAATTVLHGDITDIWFRDLFPQWKTRPVAIAGMTSGVALYCLTELARDAGLRAVYVAEHVSESDDFMRHVAMGPDEMVARASDLALAGRRWSSAAARIVMRCPLGKPSAVSTERLVTLFRAGEHSRALTSWVIAPVARAL